MNAEGQEKDKIHLQGIVLLNLAAFLSSKSRHARFGNANPYNLRPAVRSGGCCALFRLKTVKAASAIVLEFQTVSLK